MATLGTVVAVQTTATLLFQTTTGVKPDPAVNTASQIFQAGTPDSPLPVLIRNEDGTNPCTLCGVAGVAGVGTTLKAGESLTFNVVGNDSMYAIVASTSVNVSVTVMKQ